MMKRIATILLILACWLPLRAQVATVEVTRPYDVNLDGIRKPAIPTSVEDSLHRFDVHFDYSIFNRPYSDLYDFTPYESIQLATVGANRAPWSFIRLGAQYSPVDRGILPSGELYLQTRPRKGFGAGLYARHNSFFGRNGSGLDGSQILNAGRVQNTVGGEMTFDWATGELMADVRHNLDYHRYVPVGQPDEDHSSGADHLSSKFLASVNLNSANKDENTVYYDVTLGYSNTRKTMSYAMPDTLRLEENYLRVNGTVGASFEIHRIMVDMNIEMASYAGAHDFRIGVVELSPIYQLNRKWLDARLGVKFGTRFGMAGEISEPELDLSAHSSVFPDVDIRAMIIPRTLWAHAVVTGGNDLNPYSRMQDECPIVMPDSFIDFGTRQLDATFGLESVIGGRLGFNIEGNYQIYYNKLIFVPVFYGLPQMRTSYRDVRQAAAQAEVFWRSQDVTLGGRLRYASYIDPTDKTRVTELPRWTGYAYFRYNFRERLIAQVECNYRGSTSGLVNVGDGLVENYRIPSIIDMDVNINYLINKNFSVFAKVGNVLNRHNQYIPLYMEPGINFGGGICLNF